MQQHQRPQQPLPTTHLLREWMLGSEAMLGSGQELQAALMRRQARGQKQQLLLLLLSEAQKQHRYPPRLHQHCQNHLRGACRALQPMPAQWSSATAAAAAVLETICGRAKRSPRRCSRWTRRLRWSPAPAWLRQTLGVKKRCYRSSRWRAQQQARLMTCAESRPRIAEEVEEGRQQQMGRAPMLLMPGHLLLHPLEIRPPVIAGGRRRLS